MISNRNNFDTPTQISNRKRGYIDDNRSRFGHKIKIK